MHFDLIVLGGGSGGIASAVRAAKLGARVAVIENSDLGGTCVNLGCVPKKIMYNASLIKQWCDKATGYGFSSINPTFDWSVLVDNRNQYIEKLRCNYHQRFRDLNITLIQGFGCFVDTHTLCVNKKNYQAPHIIIATGGKPTVLDVPGAEKYTINSDDFFKIQSKPSKVAVIGSGYIGVEIAGILHHLGTKTHLLLRKCRPLTHFDHMLGDTLLEIMHHQQLQVHCNVNVQSIDSQKNGKKIIYSDNGSTITDLDYVIAAIGREPKTAGLNLKAAGVNQDQHGFIVVDAFQNTNIGGIYALGDVINKPALTPVAIAAGRRLCNRLFGNQPDARLDYSNICSVVFSHPPIGSVGMSEDQAIEHFGIEAIKVYQTRFNPMVDALDTQKTPTVMKLITQGVEEKIIGVHLIGYHADEILQGFGVAISMGARKQDLDDTVAIHPTSAEELVTMV